LSIQNHKSWTALGRPSFVITLQISQFFKFFMCAYLSLEPWFP
jgi:cell division protein FtsW (lipid II flippase)